MESPNPNQPKGREQALEIIGRTYRFKKGQLHYEDGARLIIYDGTSVVKVIPMTERMRTPSKIVLLCAVGYFYFIATCIGADSTLRSEPTISAAIPAIVGKAFIFLVIAAAFVFASFKSFDKAIQRLKPESQEVSAELLKRLKDAYRRGPHSAWFPYGHGPKELLGMAVGFLVIAVFCGLILFFPVAASLGLKQVYNVKAGDESYRAGDFASAEKLYRETANWTFTNGISTSSVSIGSSSTTYVTDVTATWERLALALAAQGKNEEAAKYLEMAVDKNVYWSVHPPKDSNTDLSHSTLIGYYSDDQARKVARMLGNYCTILTASGRQQEARAYAKDCWLIVFTSTTSPRRIKRLENAALRASIKSLKARDVQQATDGLHAKQTEVNENDATPPEEVLPLLIESSFANNNSKTITLDDSVIAR